MKNCVRFPHLLKSDIFDDLDIEFASAFLDACNVKIFAEETVVLEQGEPADSLILVAHGHVDVTYVGEDGRQLFLLRVRPGLTLGETETISGGPCAATCTTSDSATLLYYSGAKLEKALQNYGFIKNITRIFHKRLLKDNWLKHIAQYGAVEKRLRSHLYILSETSPKIRETQSDLATVVGCSRQTINRELSKLRAAGIIEQNGSEITVRNRIALDVDANI